MNSAVVRSLKLDKWPEPDRCAWEEACRPGHRLQRGGRAAHLKPVTQADLAQRYGFFLDFLDRAGRLDPTLSATLQITPATVSAYVDELQGRVSSVTVHGSIYKLRRATQIIDPNLDLGWLKEVELDLHDMMRPRPKAQRLVFSDRIVAAGLELMARAETEQSRTNLDRAQDARDGLMIALLAVCPIRLKNYHCLTIGESFVREGDHWWIILTDDETKSKRLDHRAVPPGLTVWIDRYVDCHRSAYPRCGDALWPSRQGCAMEYKSVGYRISMVTRRTIGHAINPHLFRHCVPHTIANMDGSRMALAAAVLQHSDPRTTEKHYTLGHSVDAARTLARIVSDLAAGID
jgi:integrase